MKKIFWPIVFVSLSIVTTAVIQCNTDNNKLSGRQTSESIPCGPNGTSFLPYGGEAGNDSCPCGSTSGPVCEGGGSGNYGEFCFQQGCFPKCAPGITGADCACVGQDHKQVCSSGQSCSQGFCY